MNFLFDNPLARMPGVWFLFLYGSLIFLSAIIVRICKINFDWTRKLPLPLIPQNPDPYELAYLRGGENEFARVLVFALIHKGFLTLRKNGASATIVLAKSQPNWTTLPALERNILPWFQVTRETKEIFDSYGLINILKPYTAEYERKITQSNFLMPTGVVAKIKFTALITGLLLAALGAFKIIAALMNGRTNVLYTAALILIAMIVFWTLSRSSRLSSLGQKYVRAVQETYMTLQARIKNPINSETSIQSPAAVSGAGDLYLLAVGVFGVGALAETIYWEYGQAFNRANRSGGTWGGDSSCSSGCGSSCSSGDSGGSSCSSGSSCGSGCGGCGGGGD